MAGKREMLSDLMFKTHATNILGRFSDSNKLIVFNYHRIRPRHAPKTLFDDGVFSADEEQFARQMKWLKCHARILSSKDIAEVLETPHHNRGYPLVAVTFDDGYYDNYTVAYPILKALEIPAFFFICTEMVWDRKLRWWDVAAYLVKRCRKPSIVVQDRHYDLMDNRVHATADLQDRMKHSELMQIHDIIQAISEACEIDIPSDDIQGKEVMTPAQICEMAENQMIIGSHTHTHRVLTLLNSEQHMEELTLSKQLLEDATGQAVNTISYPFGRHEFIPASILDACITCGYDLGFSSNFGINYLNRSHPLALNRFAGDLETVSKVAMISVVPELFADRKLFSFLEMHR